MELRLRCLQIDLARQKERADFVKSYADLAAESGYNALILYLENAVRTEDTAFFDREDTYSAEEISEIVDYAESLGLDVIPAFENLGHLEKFFCYKELESFSEIEDAAFEGRGFDNYKRGACGCVTNPALRAFMDKYITDVCSLFRSKYVHMGLDEPFDLAVCGRCKAAAAEKGKSELFYEHIMHTYELCRNLGRTMMMWDDFFEYADLAERLPRDIILCNWNYVFVGDEPQGHWTNRIKKDWFRLYDELGFQYLFCTYAHRASSEYNVDTFTAYAEKYHPLGAVMTTWRRSDSFYHGAYPDIAYAGALWSGKIKGEKDRLAAYAAALGSGEAAELVLSMNIVECGYNLNVAAVCECDYMLKLMYRDALRYALPRLKSFAERAEGRAKDVLTDIYDYVYEIYLNLRVQKLGVKIFDGYETRPRKEEYLAEIAAIEEGFAEIKKNADALWKKYRSGIKSCFDRYEKKYAGYFGKLAALKKEVASAQPRGVLYAEMMLYDPYPTVKTQIRIKYEGAEEKILFDGVTKPTVALFETGGCYSYRFATEDRKIEYIVFSVRGEGALYPLHFRDVAGGKKYVAASAEPLSGKVLRAQNVLFDDTRFAEMGEEDGVAHFNDIDLSKERHEMRVTFKPLGGEG